MAWILVSTNKHLLLQLSSKQGKEMASGNDGYRLLVSERLSGVTQLKIRDICLYIMWGHMYVICTLTFAYFCVCLVVHPVPNFTKQNLLVYLLIITPITVEIELFIVLNSFAGAVKTWKPTGVPFLFGLVALVIQCALCHVYKHTQQYLLENLLSTRLTT